MFLSDWVEFTHEVNLLISFGQAGLINQIRALLESSELICGRELEVFYIHIHLILGSSAIILNLVMHRRFW